MRRLKAKLVDWVREWVGELAIAAIIAAAGWLHGSIETLNGKFDTLDKRLARVEYSVLGIVAQATTAPTPAPKNESPLMASPLIPLPPPARDFLEEVMRGAPEK